MDGEPIKCKSASPDKFPGEGKVFTTGEEIEATVESVGLPEKYQITLEFDNRSDYEYWIEVLKRIRAQ